MIMGKARKHSRGTDNEIEEEAHVRKRSRYSLNDLPKKVSSLSKMSRFERESLVRKLRLELEQVRDLRKRIECIISSDTVLLSPYSDLQSGSDGSRRPSQGKKRPPLRNDKKGPSRPSSTVGSLMKECQTLLDRLWSHKLGLPFRIPVDPVLLNIPDYFTVVKHPMDLGTIRGRLRGGEYSGPLEFAADVRLTFSNSMAYNPPGNLYHKMAQDLSTYFESRWKVIERKIPPVVEPPVMSLTSSASLESEVPSSVAPPRKRTAAVNEGKLRVEPAAAKSVMTDGEKKKLSQDLEALGEEFPQNIVDLLSQQSGSVDQSGEVEIEIEIDTLSDEILFMLRKLLDEHLRKKKKSQEKSEPCEMEIVHDSGFSNSPLQPSKCDLLIDEDVDIVGGNDPPVSSHPPLKIEKDSACRNSSSSSSSESGSSSSDSDSCSSSGSETDSIKASNPTSTEERGVGIEKKEDDINGEKVVVNDSLNELGQVEHDAGEKSTAMDAVHVLPEEETAPPERQDSPGKRQRAALLKNRFADTIMKAREKTLTKGESGDPEKLRIEREKFEKRLKEENARLQAEAKAAEEARRKAEAEAAERAKREREQEREAARQALQKMEKTVEINESRRFMEDLEMLRTTGAEGDQLPTFTEEMSPKCSEDVLASFKMEGNSNPLEQLGLFMKMDEEDEEEDEPNFRQGEVDEEHLGRKEVLTLRPLGVEKEDQFEYGNEKPVSERGQDNGKQEDEKPINQKEGEEQIENVPVNPHEEEGGDKLVNGSEGIDEVVSEKAQDNGNLEVEELINQKEGEEQLDSVAEQENGVEDKEDEQAGVVEKGDEETQVVDMGEEEAEVMDEEIQVVDIGKEEAEVVVVDMGVEETEVVHNGEKGTEVIHKRVEETEVVDNGEKETEVVVDTGEQENEVVVDNGEKETEVVHKRVEETETVHKGEQQSEVVEEEID